ncbi:hypothetical protein [Marinomonas sp. GJ51-6]|uniref:hypothetical protein n=1 Tax=Marinomonas sp. GJ51-6 TaxID=2992802 RepID=UPI0029350993|nr:hypothetical protein [Marinomonas sp. GJ51-6]WOD07909.1 hypothetical protein ONZ50_01670 [Marinomonas sp. GJ51-6]
MDEIFNLSNISESQKKEMLESKVEFSKKSSQLASNSRKSTKSGKCLYCKESTTSYCNSHSIPASFLKNIAKDGKLLTHGGLIDLPLLNAESGVNKAGTFHIICRDCDSKIFSNYESKATYDSDIKQTTLAQIAMKNYLKTISQKAFEIAYYGHLSDDSGIDLSSINNIKDLDLKENVRGFDRARKVDLKCVQDEYYLFFCEKLSYVVPIAFQHKIALAVDLEGNVINNLYNHDPKYKIQHLHLAVFPLEEISIVMMFIDKKDTRYRQFMRQFNSLSLEDKLALSNYIIFLYSEDFFLSPSLDEEIVNDEKLKYVSGSLGVGLVGLGRSAIDLLKENYSLSGFKAIPSLLSPEKSI